MLKAIKQFKTLHWFCKVCEPDVQEFLQSESTYSKDNVECRLQTMENQLAKLTSSISNLTSNCKGSKGSSSNNSLTTSSESPGQMALRLVDEYKDHERRKMNLIFHKIPEQEATENTSKHELDKKFILSIAEELGVEGFEITGTARIGRPNESGERLLKVEVKNLNSKKQILSKAKFLRKAKNERLRKVYITPDLSYQERLQQKVLRTELHRRRNAGEMNLLIHKGQIITAQLTNGSVGMETDHSSATDAPNNNR